MVEGIQPYDPKSDKPSEFMGNWVDSDVVQKEEELRELSNPEYVNPDRESPQDNMERDLIFKLGSDVEKAMPDVLKRAKKIGKMNKTGLNDESWDQAFDECYEEAVQKLNLSEAYDSSILQEVRQRVELKYEMYAAQIKNMLGPQD